MNKTITWTTTIESANRSDQIISSFLQKEHGLPISRNQVQKLIEKNLIKVNGQSIKPKQKLNIGDVVVVEIPPPETLELIPEHIDLEILYEDDDIIVVNKPARLTVHPSETQKTGTLVHALLSIVKNLSGIGGVLRPGIVHRLDKNTSGALVVTKTDSAHQKLTKIFSAHEIERRYLAICYGCPASEIQTVTSTIGRSPSDRKKMAMNVKNGRKAITHIKVLEKYGDFASLIEAKLETGRTHQVRVHLNGIGHSILGDPVYGVPSSRHQKWLALPKEIKEATLKLPGQALHAKTLGFNHPISKKELRFEAQPPEEFRHLLNLLSRYI